jgi:triacylglycerol lipase
VTAVSGSAVAPSGRVHIVLIPGFAGFDALGQIEYYAGTTERFRRWLGNGGARGQAVVLHYFDDLPTAGVSTRAAWLGAYLAKRIARCEIEGDDRVALVGHSTGGLDIRRLLFSEEHAPRKLHLDGGAAAGRARATAIEVDQREILKKVNRVVFMSVPQYGTNIADWVRAHAALRRVVVKELLLAVDGAGIPRLEEVESGILRELWSVAGRPDLVLAARDALDETRAPVEDPVRRANAEQARSQLRLWLQHAVDDFGAIDDLASFTMPAEDSVSPAHYSEADRRKERKEWDRYGIETMSIATVGRRAFKFQTGEPAAPFDLLVDQAQPTRRLAQVAGAFASLIEAGAHLLQKGAGYDATNRDGQRQRARTRGRQENELLDELLGADAVAGARQMDISYLLTYRACAGGPFEYPPSVGKLCGDVANLNTSRFDEGKLGPYGPRRGTALEVWDNDGIVNTASMLWPNGGETRLVAADHLDIVGQYKLRKAKPSPDRSGRIYASYDALKSYTEFAQDEFDHVWEDVFDFCVS